MDDRAASGWSSGSEYTRAQVASLLAVRQEFELDVVVLRTDGPSSVRVAGVDVPVVTVPSFASGGFAVRASDSAKRRTGIGTDSRLRAWRAWADAHELDVVLSFLPAGGWWLPSRVGVGMWLWDFQHRVLPQMFPAARLPELDASFRWWAELSDLTVVSSEASKQDYLDFLPDLADKVRVFHFPSRFAFDPSLTESTELSWVRAKYRLDEHFLLVVNQFWQHKNHESVIEAARIIQERTGSAPQIVMIGLPNDDRDREGAYLSGLLGRIAEYGLEGRVKMLGFVPGVDRDALFRLSSAVVQPSRFEGWNTSIGDAVAIGRPVIASDIPVHREQLASPFGLFGVDDHERLAELMTAAAALPPGPDLEREADALTVARDGLVRGGRELVGICDEIVAAARRRA